MNVHQHIEKSEPIDRHRPDCPKCNLGMSLYSHVPHFSAEGSHEQRTYVCEVCGTTEVVKV
jgi:ribosomal protein S27AE